jgi:hypothetical protein
VSLVFLRQGLGSCPALQWDVEERRYRCGLAQAPERYLRWLPGWSHGIFRRMVLRWIAANTACDADDETYEQEEK